MKRDIIESILTILVIIVFIVIIFILLLKIFGKSPSDVGLLTAIVVGLILYTIRAEYSKGRFQGEFREFKRNVVESFVKIKEDSKELKGEFKENINKVTDEIKELRKDIKAKRK